MNAMTLLIAVHYYIFDEDYEKAPKSKTVAGAVTSLYQNDILERTDRLAPGEAKYRLTARGTAFVKGLLTVPLPELVWKAAKFEGEL